MIKDVFERVCKSGIVAVLVIDKIEDAVPVAETLLENGISAIELTLRTPVALEALAEIKRKVPRMLLGVGTVLTSAQIEDVVKAEADFAVAPGLNAKVVKKAKQLALPFAPGITTPSDIELAVELGCKVLKFFPAEAIGGIKYLSSINAPYAHLGLRYIPLGGLNSANMKTYLNNSIIQAIGGSWIASRKLINDKDWGTIAKNASEASAIVEQVRKEITSCQK